MRRVRGAETSKHHVSTNTRLKYNNCCSTFHSPLTIRLFLSSSIRGRCSIKTQKGGEGIRGHTRRKRTKQKTSSTSLLLGLDYNEPYVSNTSGHSRTPPETSSNQGSGPPRSSVTLVSKVSLCSWDGIGSQGMFP